MFGLTLNINTSVYSYENAFIFSQLQGVTQSVYIGLNDLQIERTFRWSDQSPLDYVNWYSRQPDNYWSREDCGEIWPYYNHKGKWNDVSCLGEQPYICQKGKHTDPTFWCSTLVQIFTLWAGIKEVYYQWIIFFSSQTLCKKISHKATNMNFHFLKPLLFRLGLQIKIRQEKPKC